MRQNRLKGFGLALGAITKAYHYRAEENAAPNYAVWTELPSSSLAADNSHAETCYGIAIDYYTKTEFDKTIDDIEFFLDEVSCSWRLESVQFEQDTGIIHYEWRADYA